VLRIEALEDRTVPSAPPVGYVQTNLVSDIPGLAQLTDPQLKNPWGIALSPQGPFTIADESFGGAGVSTSYAVTEASVTQVSPTISFPTVGTGPLGPTGMVRNDTSSFLANGTPASFIYAAHNPPPPSLGVSVIAAWNPSLGTTAQVEATTPGAVYTGLDLESTPSGDFLYAADAIQNRIDVFDSSFNKVTLPAGAFVDPELPMPLTPFNIEGINGNLYVAYAPKGRPAASSAPEGAGAVAVFDTSGNFITQLIAGGKLAAPWGIVLAPQGFGQFSGDLLVGNYSFKATEINAFDPASGAYLGTVTDSSGNTLLSNAQGLWDLTFGNGGNGGLPKTLYFATGLNNEADGLFGAITPARRPGIAPGAARANDSGAVLTAVPSALGTELPPAFQGLDVAIQFQPSDPFRIVSPVFALNLGAGSESLPALHGLRTAARVIPPSPISPVFFGLADRAATTPAGPSQDALDQVFAGLGDEMGDALWTF
jgi:uncharacterized protein (TIGR03118 family)